MPDTSLHPVCAELLGRLRDEDPASLPYAYAPTAFDMLAARRFISIAEPDASSVAIGEAGTSGMRWVTITDAGRAAAGGQG